MSASSFEALLARNGHLVYRTRGVSMEPMLHENRDLVIIRVPVARLKKYDVALYKRGKSYVLHRVVGVLTGFVRRGKRHAVTERGYRAYVHIWQALYPLRARMRLAKLARRLGLAPLAGRAREGGGPE